MTLRICRDRNILVECLKEREAEVMSIRGALFGQEEVTRRCGFSMKGEERRSNIRNMLQRGKTPEEISDFCGYQIELVREVQDEMLVS